MRRELRERYERLRGNEKYYRAVRIPAGRCKCGILIPRGTDVEKVEIISDNLAEVKYWQPIVNEPPIFFRSTEKVLCFSKTPGGAVIGAVTGEIAFTGGRFCICETTEQPDIDISHVVVGDFSVLEEVRYRRPVDTRFVGESTVDDRLLKEIANAYETKSGFPDVDRLVDIREKINREIIFRRSR